jgi:putative ABC transport system permease protein
MELYAERLTKSGRRSANWRFVWDVVKLFRLGIIRDFRSKTGIRFMDMFVHDIRVSFRSISKNRMHSSINIIGLTSSICCALFIYAYVQFELSYHDFHPKKESIYRVLMKDTESGSLSRPTPTPLIPALKSDFSNALSHARFGQDPVFTLLEDKSFYEANFYWADSSYRCLLPAE